MLRNVLLAGVWLAFLTACGTVPSAPQPTKVVTICPRLPALDPLDPETQAALETDFTATIARLLSGLAPLATDYELRSNNAGSSTNAPRLPRAP